MIKPITICDRYFFIPLTIMIVMTGEEAYQMLQKEIKRLREAAGLTQQELSEKIHLTQHALSQYETGNRQVTLEVFEDILKALGVQVKFQVLDKNMHLKVLTSKFFDTWRDYEKMLPEWRIEHSGGGIWTAQKDFINKFGQETMVLISQMGAIVYRRLEKSDTAEFGYKVIEDHYITEEEYKKEDGLYWEHAVLSEQPLFLESVGGYEMKAASYILFTHEQLEQMIVVANML